MPLDFAIEGDGFFAVNSANGTVYTRAGSFALDDEGYLCQPDGSRVLDPSGEEIYLGTDKIRADDIGAIYTEDGQLLGQIGLYIFDDTTQLQRTPEGYFTGNGAQNRQSASIHWKMQERSNADLVEQMTGMMTAQRAFQSAAEVSKMYDDLMGKAATSLANV